MKYYYPYPANNGKHKYFIITKSDKKIYFGAVGYSDFTKHKDEERKQLYINRHKNMGARQLVKTTASVSSYI